MLRRHDHAARDSFFLTEASAFTAVLCRVFGLSTLVVGRILPDIGHRRVKIPFKCAVAGQAERIEISEIVTSLDLVSHAVCASAVGRIAAEPSERLDIEVGPVMCSGIITAGIVAGLPPRRNS